MSPGITYFGTTGWLHSQWRGPFYPLDLPVDDWLRAYMEEFPAVEIEESSHTLPEAAVMSQWRTAVGEQLKFLLRAPRSITHTRKLKNCEVTLQTLFSRATLLKTARGPVIFELPSAWQLNLRRLRAFLDMIPKGQKIAFDFPHPSWHCIEVFSLLESHAACCCIRDRDGPASLPYDLTDTVIIRLQGPNKPHGEQYRSTVLRNWVDKSLAWNRRGKNVYLLFDSDEALYSMKNARRFRGLLTDLALHIP